MRWLMLAVLFAAAGCIPAGGGGGGDDDDGGGETDADLTDPDDGIPPRDMFVDPDDGIPPRDMRIDPDDGIPPDMSVDPDDGVPGDMGIEPGAERCNMLDDDGDDAIDEGFGGLGEPCFIGLGLCEAEGVVICTPDGTGTVCDAASAGPVAEQCNGLDDDCDGAVDEDLAAIACDTGASGRCADGLEQCVDGEALCIPRLDPTDEVCNGEDDDCDGRGDEDIPARPCATGQPGQCADGTEICDLGGLVCRGPAPQPEQCGGDDLDCDGAVDEGGVCDACDGVECPPGRVCVDGACVADDPCAGVMCPPESACQDGRCVPIDVGDAIPIAPLGEELQLEGALNADAPVWGRPNANCEAPGADDHHYRAIRVVNRTGAPRSLSILGTWGATDGYLHVYADPFDAGDLAGCLAGNDDFNGTGSSRVTDVVIGVGQVRVIVISTYDGGATIPAYVLRVQTLAADGGFEEDCADGRDDDGNGLTDCEDPLCEDDPACLPAAERVPGVQQNVRLADVEARGWRRCYASLFSRTGDRLDTLLADCDGEELMLACRRTGADTLQLAAEGLRADVTFDVGRGADVSHNANGVEWYYSPTRAWGFAPGGAAINLNSCDFGEADRADQRMCIHLNPGAASDVIDNGYRCGDNDLNNNADFERLVLTR